MALDVPISRGRKYDEHASMMMPRLEKTNPIFAGAYATRILAGRHMVMPTPTAAPLIAAMVGFEQLCIASETLPPLSHMSAGSFIYL